MLALKGGRVLRVVIDVHIIQLSYVSLIHVLGLDYP